MRLRRLLWAASVFVAFAGSTQAYAQSSGAWGGSSGYGYGWCGGYNGIPYSTGCSGPGMGYNGRYCPCGGCNGYASGFWGGPNGAGWVATYGANGYAPAAYGTGAAPAPQTAAPATDGITPPPPPAYPTSAALPAIPTQKVSISKLLRSQH